MFSNVRIQHVNTKGPVKARGSVTVADAVNINVSVMEGRNGLFVGLPRHKGKDKEGKDKWYYDVFISNKSLLETLNKLVLAEYEKSGKSNGNTLSQAASPEPEDQDGIPW